MVTKSLIQDFLSQRNLAIVGISRNSRKFGNTIFNGLKSKGYNVIPVNPNLEIYDNQKCYPDLSSIKEQIDGVVVVVPPKKSEAIVREASSLGIHRIWLQQGASSKEIVKYCEENGINVIHGYCIFMFAEPSEFFHRVHRWFMKIFGKLPE